MSESPCVLSVRRPVRPLGRLARALVAVAAAAAGQAAAGEAIRPGDVLRVEIAEAPELGREEAKVGLDGRIALPRVGGVDVAGADVDAARARIEAVLVSAGLLREPTVLVEVAALRPFYVGGAVANPGALAFEPGLTVRHALILAGGLDRGEGTDRLGAVELVELQARWRAKGYHLLQVDSRIARLEAELAQAEAPDFRAQGPVVAAEAAEPVRRLQSDLFRERMADRVAHEAHLHDLIGLVDFEIDVLTQQYQLQQEAEAIQKEQLSNSRTLFEKGLLPLTRLQALEFDLSRISRDVLSNRAFIAQARQNKATRQYQLETEDAKRRMDLRQDLLQALAERAAVGAEVETLAAALLSAGIEISQDETLAEPEPEVTVFRAQAGATESFAADMETEIRPGDVLQVSIASRRRGS